jgi:hypothetical protein
LRTGDTGRHERRSDQRRGDSLRRRHADNAGRLDDDHDDHYDRSDHAEHDHRTLYARGRTSGYDAI